MTEDFATAREEELRSLVESLLRFDTTGGNERPAQDWLAGYLADAGFETYEWTADADDLAAHPSFPDDPGEIDVADRPSVAGVVEFGDPGAGPTLVLNGHADVVPVEGEVWSTDPFEPTWRDGAGDGEGVGDDGASAGDGETLTARGAADMKAGLAACVVAATALRDRAEDPDGDPGSGDPADPEDHPADLDGRLVVESVAGEEEGGIGAAAAALSNPYPFERDAAIVAEPTDLRAVTATEGTVMKRLRVEGRSAHAATRWRGESVLPHFRAIHDAFEALEAERADRVRHPLYDRFENPWPITAGVVRAGTWASTVPAELTAEFRIGVAPGETVDEVEAEFEQRLDEVVADSEWLSAHPPEFERFSIQFEPAAVDADEPVVRALRAALRERGLDDEPRGATYGADSRHYVAAGIPTVVFGPGTIEQAHSPDETIRWAEVRTATGAIADAARRFLAK